MRIAPASRLVSPDIHMPTSVAGASPAAAPPPSPPGDPRLVMKRVASSAYDSIVAAWVSTTTTAKIDPTTTFWINRSSRLCGAAQASLEAADAMMQLVPGMNFSARLALIPLAEAQSHIGVAADAPIGSDERRANIERANMRLHTAMIQLSYMIRQSWPT